MGEFLEQILKIEYNSIRTFLKKSTISTRYYLVW